MQGSRQGRKLKMGAALRSVGDAQVYDEGISEAVRLEGCITPHHLISVAHFPSVLCNVQPKWDDNSLRRPKPPTASSAFHISIRRSSHPAEPDVHPLPRTHSPTSGGVGKSRNALVTTFRWDDNLMGASARATTYATFGVAADDRVMAFTTVSSALWLCFQVSRHGYLLEVQGLPQEGWPVIP